MSVLQDDLYLYFSRLSDVQNCIFQSFIAHFSARLPKFIGGNPMHKHFVIFKNQNAWFLGFVIFHGYLMVEEYHDTSFSFVLSAISSFSKIKMLAFLGFVFFHGYLMVVVSRYDYRIIFQNIERYF